ncbi:MAG: YceI family protein [Pseudomonadales bacterium]
MNKTRMTLASLLLCAGSMTAQAADYVIDKPGQHAYVTFKASHLGFSYIIGHFEEFAGGFTYDESNPAASSAQVTIKTASLDSDHAERDKHLKGDEYLDAARYPEVSFTSTGYSGDAKAGQLHGKLNFRGVTRDVSIDVKHIGQGDDPWGGYRAGFEGTVMLSAADYNLPAWIGDVEVYLVVEGIRQ